MMGFLFRVQLLAVILVGRHHFFGGALLLPPSLSVFSRGSVARGFALPLRYPTVELRVLVLLPLDRARKIVCKLTQALPV